MGSTICTAGFPSAAIASSCFTARCDSIWYGFFIATLLFLGKRNCSQPIKGFEPGSRYFLRSTGHSRRGGVELAAEVVRGAPQQCPVADVQGEGAPASGDFGIAAANGDAGQVAVAIDE